MVSYSPGTLTFNAVDRFILPLPLAVLAEPVALSTYSISCNRLAVEFKSFLWWSEKSAAQELKRRKPTILSLNPATQQLAWFNLYLSAVCFTTTQILRLAAMVSYSPRTPTFNAAALFI